MGDVVYFPSCMEVACDRSTEVHGSRETPMGPAKSACPCLPKTEEVEQPYTTTSINDEISADVSDTKVQK